MDSKREMEMSDVSLKTPKSHLRWTQKRNGNVGCFSQIPKSDIGWIQKEK